MIFQSKLELDLVSGASHKILYKVQPDKGSSSRAAPEIVDLYL
jgi:hypothetical protein